MHLNGVTNMITNGMCFDLDVHAEDSDLPAPSLMKYHTHLNSVTHMFRHVLDFGRACTRGAVASESVSDFLP